MVRGQGWSEHAKKSEPRGTHPLQRAEDGHQWADIHDLVDFELRLKSSRRLLEPRLSQDRSGQPSRKNN